MGPERDDLSAHVWHEGATGAPDTEVETRELLESLYRDFNARDIHAILVQMTDDIAWPDGWEGGYVHGHGGVRDYWTRQWAQIDPTVKPLGLATLPHGRADVTGHQVVRDQDGGLLSDSTVHHLYRLDSGRITHMEIRGWHGRRRQLSLTCATGRTRGAATASNLDGKFGIDLITRLLPLPQ